MSSICFFFLIYIFQLITPEKNQLCKSSSHANFLNFQIPFEKEKCYILLIILFNY